MTKKTDVIAHRGASGYVPEHSLEAYLLAVSLGADYVEPDLVLSKDGIFFALHDILLDDTTNIADHPQFANRRKTGLVEGVVYTGYFVSDFTAAELKLLRLQQRLPLTRSTLLDGFLEIPKLTEIFALVSNLTSMSGRRIGLYPELKHPIYFNSLGFPMEDMVLEYIAAANYSIRGVNPSLINEIAPIVIQSFIPEALIYLRTKCDLPLVQLMARYDLYGYGPNQLRLSDVWNATNLDLISQYASGVGPPVTFFTDDINGDYQTAKYMTSQARARGLAVHPYVLRWDSEVSSKSFDRNATKETLFFVCCLEVDGIFTDYTDRTRQAVELAFVDPTRCADICPSKFAVVPSNMRGISAGYSQPSSQSYFMFLIVFIYMLWEPVVAVFGKGGKSLA